MIDGKMVGLLQGDSGAFCHMCHVSREEENDIKLIVDRFEITKNFATYKAAWEKIVKVNTFSRVGIIRDSASKVLLKRTENKPGVKL